MEALFLDKRRLGLCLGILALSACQAEVNNETTEMVWSPETAS